MRFEESPALAKLHHIVSKLSFCFRKLYPTASRNLRAVVQFHHTACCPLVFRISVAQFYHTAYCPLVLRISFAQFHHTAYCPLVFRISAGQFHHTQHTALWFSVSQDGCPISPRTQHIALWFSEYHNSCPILPHTQHTAAWFSESQDINWFLPISPQIQHCPSDFRISGCKPSVASFTTDSALPF